ncbi:glycosyltransferase family 4 protein [Candidatus Saganbacteria bacterium]|nr:glycosyltransferase family 4 protein [Candidatus Saganbacteria bacterium]
MISALKADRIILSSKDSLDLVLETGVSRSKCRQCYLGVKPFSLPLVNKEKIILLVSNIYSHKNIKTLVRAFSLLKEEIRQEFRLIIVGKTVGIESEAELNALLCLRKKLYLDENVVFNTEVDGKELAHLYASSLIFVMPSLIESFSFPVFEAMSSGLPVIAANATCLPEVLDGAGLLFRPDSPVDLAEKLTRLIEDPGLAATLAIKGKERAALFTWAKTTALLLGYFKELEKEPRNT